jgi:tetratricopeptide (TPR) repeat protein
VPFRSYLVRVTAFLIIAVLSSCSVEKNTSLSRNYHDLTSHYNTYFNGKESYKKGVEKAETSVKYDFTDILPVFLYEDESLHSLVTPGMKTAIDKATKVITYHSITAKPKVKEGDQTAKDKAFYDRKEYNKWVDDCYMLMGKAYMYQGEFFLAAETFKHVMVTFPVDEVRYLGMIWLARAYIMIGELREAERLVTALADQSEFPEEYIGELLSTRCQLDLKKESYASATGYLEEAMLQKGFSKDEKIRYTFILGQLYEEAGEKSLAQEKYRQVTRYNPPYEMAFNARVSMAGVFETGSTNSAELKKLLNKMLRDSKNLEYKDQIYFALGSIAFQEGDREQAIEYYQLSVSSSVQNQYQKGYSSVTLADIYYKEPDYLHAAAYYDSAVSFLNKEYPGYASLVTRSASLSKLVYNYNTYTLQDSLQMMAALPEEQRLAIIDGIIEEVRLAEEEARENERQAMQDMAFNQSMIYDNQTGSQGGQQGGEWYFYNLNAKSFGQPEFRMKWGERKLEDNWRRKNKQSISSVSQGSPAEGDSIEGGNGGPVFDNKSREYYLANIPLTDSAMEVSNLRLEEALFNMGVIYKENLLDYQEAIRVFEELVGLFPYPVGRFNDQAMYFLHELHNSVQQPGIAESYKGKLQSQYPDSHYTKLLTNPNYIRELEEEEMKVVRLYEGVFAKYQSGDYQGLIVGADHAISEFPDDPLVPKFMYIKALAAGAMTGKEEMKAGLDSLIAHYPGTEEGIKAQEIIDYMYVAFPVIREADEAKEAEVIYADSDPGQEHYFLLAIQSGENINQVSFDLLNYNLDNFNEYNLEVERLELSDKYYMIVVQMFTNANGAQRYLEVIRENSSRILAGIPESNYRMMIISKDNYATLSREKVHNPYYLFYQKYYLNQEL